MPALRVSDNHRFLITEDGRPFFWLADTAWWIRRLTPDEADVYLAQRAEQGFNVIQVHTGFAEADFAGNIPFLEADTDRPNEAFWRNVDALVERARAHGLYIALVPMWGQEYAKAVGTDTAKARRLGRWIGGRYAGHSHVLWIVSGEYDAINGFRLPISPEQKAVLNAMAEGLREAHHGAQLMTIHPGAARTSSLDFHAEAWLDFNMLQSGHMIDCRAFGAAENYELIAHDYGLSPMKPTLDGEPIYEDTPDGVWVVKNTDGPRADAAAVRRKAWWAVFAGACGHTYGHNDVYGFCDPAHPERAQDLPQGPGRHDWRAALEAEGATQMRHVRSLMESRPFLDRIPDPSLVLGEPGTRLDHVSATRAADGSYAMVYVPRGKPVSVALTRLSADRLTAWWYDPRTGLARRVGDLEGRGSREFMPPTSGDGQDWVLVLDDAARAFGPPGGR